MVQIQGLECDKRENDEEAWDTRVALQKQLTHVEGRRASLSKKSMAAVACRHREQGAKAR